MNEIQHELLNRLSVALYNKSYPMDSSDVSDELIKEARVQAVSCIITKDYQVLSSSLRITLAHAKLTEVLSDIPFVTIKGYASAHYYPDPIKRTMGDVDFYVEPEFYQDAKEKLINNKFDEVQVAHDRHETFVYDRIRFELHSEIKGLPNGIDGIKTANHEAEDNVRRLLSDIIDTSISVSVQEGTVVIPDNFHHGLVMLLHIAGHILNDGGVGLRHICDWAVYVNHVNLENYRDKLTSVGLWRFACQLTALCCKYLGLPPKSWVGECDDAFLKDFMEDILDAGNFGCKSNGRGVVLNVKRESLVQITRKRYPAANNAFLLPFFILRNIIRYVWLIISGKRKRIKVSTIFAAGDRKRLYEKFHLFE